jgi:hypothetical protein
MVEKVNIEWFAFSNAGVYPSQLYEPRRYDRLAASWEE